VKDGSAELVYQFMRPVPGVSKATFCHRNPPVEKSLGRSAPDPQSIGVAHEKETYRAYHAYRALLFGKPAHENGCGV
jgi:hypothetical protein